MGSEKTITGERARIVEKPTGRERKEKTTMQELERPQIYTEKGDLAYWADASLNIEKPRISGTVRLAHLAKTGRTSPDTERFVELIRNGPEAFADERLAALIVDHPTWPWASRILGVGKENYPKVVGSIEKFARYYDIGNPMIPPYVNRDPQHYLKVEAGKVVEKEGIWVEGIERLATVSKLYKYRGVNVDPETGETPKRRAGHKLSFNAELKMAHYRLDTSLLRATGIWYYGGKEDGCSPGYLGYRDRITERKEAKGVKIVSTPTERMCLNCNIEVKAKKTLYCPNCGEKLTLKNEPPGYLFMGHLHMMALREMSKDFDICMWLVWREALGLPVTQAYKVVKLDHKPIDPWKMVDR